MMKWRPWPPLVSRKYEVRLVVKRLEGLDPPKDGKGVDKLTVEVKWKGPKMALSPLRRTAVKRNYTKEADGLDQNGVTLWDEEFLSVCTLSAYKENVFHPWEIVFSAFNVSLILGFFFSVEFCSSIESLATFCALRHWVFLDFDCSSSMFGLRQDHLLAFPMRLVFFSSCDYYIQFLGIFFLKICTGIEIVMDDISPFQIVCELSYCSLLFFLIF